MTRDLKLRHGYRWRCYRTKKQSGDTIRCEATGQCGEHAEYVSSFRLHETDLISGPLKSFTSDTSIAAKLNCSMETIVFRMMHAHNCHVNPALVRNHVFVEKHNHVYCLLLASTSSMLHLPRIRTWRSSAFLHGSLVYYASFAFVLRLMSHSLFFSARLFNYLFLSSINAAAFYTCCK